MNAFTGFHRDVRGKSKLSQKFRPSIEGLEGRALLAVGQITALFTLPVGVPVNGDLPDGSVDLHDMTFSSQNITSPTSAMTGAGAGKVTFGQLSLSELVGRQTPGLFQVEASGQHFKSVLLTVRNGAAQKTDTYMFNTVFVAGQTISADSGGNQIEHDQLSFGSVQFTHFDAVSGKAVSQGTWNQLTNTPIVSPLFVRKSTSAVLPAAVLDPNAPIATNTSLAISSPKGSNFTTLTATVIASSGHPTGRVSFYSGKTQLAIVDVGPDGKASVSLPGKYAKNKLFAIYSGGPESPFAPSSSVAVNKSSTLAAFNRIFHRPMNSFEWTLTSIWLGSGAISTKQLYATYAKLANTNGK